MTDRRVLMEQHNMAFISGHNVAKRALEVAGVARVPVLLVGERGIGKTALAVAHCVICGVNTYDYAPYTTDLTRILTSSQFVIRDFDLTVGHTLVNTAWTCPCGQHRSIGPLPCLCSGRAREEYWERLAILAMSYPIVVECVARPDMSWNVTRGEDSKVIARRISTARELFEDAARLQESNFLYWLDFLTESGRKAYRKALEFWISPARCFGILKVALGIACLNGRQTIDGADIMEAFQYLWIGSYQSPK